MSTSPSARTSAEYRVKPSARRRWVRYGLGLLAVALLVWGVVAQRDELAEAVRDFTVSTVVVAAGVVLAGLIASMLSWRSVLAGLGSRLPIRVAARVYFLAQLGKYIPGSVWPMLAQVELSSDYGVPRVRSGVASIAALVVGLVVGTVVGVIGLASATSAGLWTYLWVLIVVPIGVILLCPPVLQRLIAFALRVARKPQLDQPIDTRPLLASAAWSLLMWMLFGVQAWLLARDLGATGPALFALCCGAYAISWIVGFLVVFAPAGAGPREAALVVTLATVLPRPDALALALVSRGLMLVGDVICVLVALLLGRARHEAKVSS